MRVLIAIDESNYSKEMIEEVSTRQWTVHTSFQVLNVLALPTSDQWQNYGLTVWPELKERLSAEANQLVQTNVSYLKEKLGAEAHVEGKVVEGQVCDSIIHAATEWKADLIMVGSHGRSGIEKFFLGSVAEAILLHAPCSIEVFKLKQKKSHSETPSSMRTAGPM